MEEHILGISEDSSSSEEEFMKSELSDNSKPSLESEKIAVVDPQYYSQSSYPQREAQKSYLGPRMDKRSPHNSTMSSFDDIIRVQSKSSREQPVNEFQKPMRKSVRKLSDKLLQLEEKLNARNSSMSENSDALGSFPSEGIDARASGNSGRRQQIPDSISNPKMEPSLKFSFVDSERRQAILYDNPLLHPQPPIPRLDIPPSRSILSPRNLPRFNSHGSKAGSFKASPGRVAEQESIPAHGKISPMLTAENASRLLESILSPSQSRKPPRNVAAPNSKQDGVSHPSPAGPSKDSNPGPLLQQRGTFLEDSMAVNLSASVLVKEEPSTRPDLQSQPGRSNAVDPPLPPTSDLTAWHAMKSNQAVNSETSNAVKEGHLHDLGISLTSMMRTHSQDTDLTAIDPEDPAVQLAVESTRSYGSYKPILDLMCSPEASGKLTREAAKAVRELTRVNALPAIRARLVENEGVDRLLSLFDSPDRETVEHAVTAVYNLALEENIRDLIFTQKTIGSLVKIVNGDVDGARTNAAATICLFADTEDRQLAIGKVRGVLPALLGLVKSGPLRGRKDAALALLFLSLAPANREAMVGMGFVSFFLELLKDDEEREMHDKAMAVLRELSRDAGAQREIVGDDDNVSALVEVLQSGNETAKINSVQTLLGLCNLGEDVRKQIIGENAMTYLPKLISRGPELLKIAAIDLRNFLKCATVKEE